MNQNDKSRAFLEELAENDQKDYADTIKKYPYGLKEHERILALTDLQFEAQIGGYYRRISSEYESYKDEASEFQMYTISDVDAAKKKYEYFKALRNRIKEEGGQKLDGQELVGQELEF